MKISNNFANLTHRKHYSINVNSAIIAQLHHFARRHRLSYGQLVNSQSLFIYI